MGINICSCPFTHYYQPASSSSTSWAPAHRVRLVASSSKDKSSVNDCWWLSPIHANAIHRPNNCSGFCLCSSGRDSLIRWERVPFQRTTTATYSALCCAVKPVCWFGTGKAFACEFPKGDSAHPRIPPCCTKRTSSLAASATSSYVHQLGDRVPLDISCRAKSGRESSGFFLPIHSIALHSSGWLWCSQVQ